MTNDYYLTVANGQQMALWCATCADIVEVFNSGQSFGAICDAVIVHKSRGHTPS